MQPDSRLRDFACGHFSTKPMDTSTVALILELLNSQENCSSESQKVSLLQLQRLLSFPWICSDKSYNFPFPHGKGEGGLKTLQQYSKAQTQRSGQQRPEPSCFLLLSALLSQGQRAGKEKEKWLQPLARVKEFWGCCSLQCIWEQGELPVAPWPLPSAFLCVQSQPHLLMAWLCPKFMLPEQTWSVSPLCLHAVSVAVFIPLKNRYSKRYTTTLGAFVCLGTGVYVCARVCVTPQSPSAISPWLLRIPPSCQHVFPLLRKHHLLSWFFSTVFRLLPPPTLSAPHRFLQNIVHKQIRLDWTKSQIMRELHSSVMWRVVNSKEREINLPLNAGKDPRF